jgi:hypothetical protein
MSRVGTGWLLVAALIVGCGSGEVDTVNYRDTPAYQRKTEELRQQRAEERQINKEVRELEENGQEEKAPNTHAPQPEAAPSNSLAASVRKESSEFCSIFPQAKMAREYGVRNELDAVAHAYASEYRSELQPVAEGGCIEGLAP